MSRPAPIAVMAEHRPKSESRGSRSPARRCIDCASWRATRLRENPQDGSLTVKLCEGECRISSPRGVVDVNGELVGRWPIVMGSAWCGSFHSGDDDD